MMHILCVCIHRDILLIDDVNCEMCLNFFGLIYFVLECLVKLPLKVLFFAFCVVAVVNWYIQLV